MKSYLWVASLALVAFVILVASARADDERGTLVRFKGVSESILSRTSSVTKMRLEASRTVDSRTLSAASTLPGSSG